MSDPAPVSNSVEVFYLIVDHENKITRSASSVHIPPTSSIATTRNVIAKEEVLGLPGSKLEVYVFSGDLDDDDAKRQEQIKEFFCNKPIREGEKRRLDRMKYSEDNDVLIVRLPGMY